MAEFKIRKSQALPTTLEPNTIYLIKSASDTEVTVFISDKNATTPNAKGLTYLNKKGGTMTGSLGLAGVSTNAFVAGTGDNNTFGTYNFGLSGWNSMAFINPTIGGAFPTQVSGLVDFRNGIINMKGGFQVNGQTVWHAGTFNPANYKTIFSASSVSLISSGFGSTSSAVYTSVFQSGSNIILGNLKRFDITKLLIYDVIKVELTFRNITTTANKAGILRYKLGSGADKFIEVRNELSKSYSGKFEINITYLGSNNYGISSNLYITEGLQNGPQIIHDYFTQTITTNWVLKMDFLSGVVGGSTYGGKTDFQHQISHKKSTENIFTVAV